MDKGLRAGGAYIGHLAQFAAIDLALDTLALELSLVEGTHAHIVDNRIGRITHTSIIHLQEGIHASLADPCLLAQAAELDATSHTSAGISVGIDQDGGVDWTHALTTGKVECRIRAGTQGLIGIKHKCIHTGLTGGK